MKALSQRDQLWGKDKLGFSNTLIENYGCTITCLTMLAGLFNVGDVNKRLKAVNGYANGNLLIWSKIKEAFSWLEFEWRGYSYDNNRVKQAIIDYGGCLVEVDGSPIGGDKHWVLYIGNGRLIDPWDGKEKPTSTYIAIGYSIIKNFGIIEPEGDGMSEELRACLDDRKKFWDERDEMYNALGKDNQASAIAEIKRLQKRDADFSAHKCPECPSLENNYAEENKGLNTQIELLKKDISSLNNDLEKCKAQVANPPVVEAFMELNGRTITEISYNDQGQKIKEDTKNYRIVER